MTRPCPAIRGTEAARPGVGSCGLCPLLAGARRYPAAAESGAKGARTPDLLVANQTLFQLSYSPARAIVSILSTRRLRAASALAEIHVKAHGVATS